MSWARRAHASPAEAGRSDGPAREADRGRPQNTILGGLLAFSSRLRYPVYQGRPERYGIDAVTDQRVGGAIMWVPGDLVFLAGASLAFFLWLAEEERAQLRRERRT
ncbi:MAG: cytochrome c oxidase assembly protein [Chloroflexi bacterium]|nr:cytochrome c oxidase assembly protein [Chloroflexota bacterium]